MKLLQIMAGAKFGGAEEFFTRMALAMNNAGVEQRVVIRNHPKRAATLAGGGVKVLQLPFGGAIDIYTPFQLKREIKSFSPDIVLSWMNRAANICPKGNFVHVGRLGGYYNCKYYRNCDHLVGNTQDIVNYLANAGWPEDRVHYLPNFVNEDLASPVPRRDFYVPERAPLILAMGRLHQNKAFDVLLKAIVRLPDCYLWLAGDGPLRGDLEALSESLGVKPRVRFLGWRDDPGALIAACDICVCPSRHEPLGNVVIEAWAHFTPVVAADSLGPGVLIEHMESGLLVPVDDHISMANGLKLLLADGKLRSHLIEHGRATYEASFTENVVVKKYLDFFGRVIG